jgi:sulfate transport system permease protein
MRQETGWIMTRRTLTSLALRSAAIGYVVALILVPLLAIGVQSFENGAAKFLEDIRQPQAAAALFLTIKAALVATMINAVFGTVSAWVLSDTSSPAGRF